MIVEGHCMDKERIHFSRNDTKAIKGIAIVLMLMHHLWTFSERIPLEYTILTPVFSFTLNGKEVFTAFGEFGKICVSMFMFLGGYALYKQCTVEKIGFSLEQKIIKIYSSYWRVFFIYIPMGFLFFSQQVQCTEAPYHNKYTEFNLNKFILNFIGVSSSYNDEWWFLFPYIIVTILGYICIELIKEKKKKSFYTESLLVVCLTIFIVKILPTIGILEIFKNLKSDILFKNIFLWHPATCAFFMGIIMARHNWFEEKINAISNRYSKIVQCVISTVGMLIVFYLRTFNYGIYLDIFFAPLFSLFCLMILKNCKVLYIMFVFLGKHSTNIWLIHSFYCYYFTSITKVIYCSRNAIIDLGVLLSFSLVSSIMIEQFYMILGRITDRIWIVKCKNNE